MLVAVPWRQPGAKWVAGLFTALVVATVGASRVVLGAHYLSDVVGGLLWAGALLACATVALRRWWPGMPTRIGSDGYE